MDSKSSIITPDNKQFVFTRYLPKSGQTIQYVAGDDGDWEAGWNIGARFITKTISGDDIVIDRATGLMWPRDFAGDGGFSGGLAYWSGGVGWCGGLNFAGFTDWRLPNVRELLSICDYSLGGGGASCWYSIFQNRVPDTWWTSTTQAVTTTNAFIVSGGNGNTALADKDLQKRIFVVRAGCTWK